MPKIILSMIVRNEAHVIKRCLQSVKDIIDGFYVVDTGSIDDTIGIIYGELRDIPGEVVHSPWTNNFSLHRNEALEKIPKDSYALCVDADDELQVYPYFKKEELTQLAYAIPHSKDGICKNHRVILFKPDGLKWRKTRHEVVVGMDEAEICRSLMVKVNNEGARSKSNKFEDDIEAIEFEIERCGSLDGSEYFDLAQSYKDAGYSEKAIQAYEHFINFYRVPVMREMRCVACITCAGLEANGYNERTREFLERAIAIDETRIEPYVYLTEYFLNKGQFDEAVKVSAKAIQLPKTFHYLNEVTSLWSEGRYKIHNEALSRFNVYKEALNQHCANGNEILDWGEEC